MGLKRVVGVAGAFALIVCLYGFLLYVWNWYDVSVFSNWVIAFKELGLLKLYEAPRVFGVRFRNVYPPLAPIFYVANYELAEKMVYLISVILGMHQAPEYLVLPILKILLYAVIGVVGYVLWRRAGVEAAIAWFLGAPTVVVAAAYNFDVIIALLILASLYAAYRGSVYASSILLALAVLVKPLPAIFYLPVAAVLYRLRGRGAAAKYLLAGAATGAAILAPFLAIDARSTLYWMIGFHAERPPQGPSILLLFRLAGIQPPHLLWLLCFAALSAPVLLYAYRRAPREPWSLGLLLVAMMAAYLAVGKVVNPQYYVWVYPLLILAAVPASSTLTLLLYNMGCASTSLYYLLSFIAGMATGHVFIEDEERWYSTSYLLKSSIHPALQGRVAHLLHDKPFIHLADALYANWHAVAAALAIVNIACMLAVYVAALRMLKHGSG